MTAPVWLRDEAWLLAWLHWFLDRLETPRSQAITRRVTPSTLPALYRFGEDTRYRWRLLEQLAGDYGIFEIRYDTQLARHQEPYENAQFRLRPESEPLLRAWLDRPRDDPAVMLWREALLPWQDHFADQGLALLASRPDVAGYSPPELVAAFAAVKQQLGRQLSLREVSARCFRGDSKFLDQRLELLNKLYGPAMAQIVPRPLLLTAWAPAGFSRLLIVENQDSFLRLVATPPATYALLYSGGFRASAARLHSAHTCFAFLPGSDAAQFRQRWLSPDTSCHFWGDLDFAGMGILKALRNSLPLLQAWQEGYQPLLELLLAGHGHTARQAGKAGQSDPGTTGCAFADSVLLPALRSRQRFIDQEAVHPPGCGAQRGL